MENNYSSVLKFRRVIKVLIALLFFQFISLNEVKSQVIFTENFGETTTRQTSIYMPTGTFAFGDPNGTVNEKAIENNHYAVIDPNHIVDDYPNPYYWFWTGNQPVGNTGGDNGNPATDDHTTGDTNGAVLVVNAGTTLSDFYERQVSLELDQCYRLSVWMYVVNAGAQITLEAKDVSNGSVLGFETIPFTSTEDVWTEYTLDFKIPAGCTSADVALALRNNNSNNSGNDFYIDDIQLEKLTLCTGLEQTITCPVGKIPTDSDNDGVSDIDDLDDDNDGILDCEEKGISSSQEFQDVFSINGDAVQVAPKEVRLTQNINDQSGQAFSKNTLSFNKDFSFSFEANLGTNDGGADGIAIVFHNDPQGSLATGANGQGIGAGGITNGIVLEIDTWDNGAGLNDIPNDHTMIWDSDNQAAGVLSSAIDFGNLEDGAWHQVSVSWDSELQTLTYFVDNTLAGSYTGDLINTYFGGTPFVYFGFTASTGGAVNNQSIRFADFCDIPVYIDTDNDSIPDNLDTDSDGDGCFDAIEGNGSFTNSDIDGNGALTGSVDASGVPTIASGGQSTTAAVTNSGDTAACDVIDTDADGIIDSLDLDDDNDGILDTDECTQVEIQWNHNDAGGQGQAVQYGSGADAFFTNANDLSFGPGIFENPDYAYTYVFGGADQINFANAKTNNDYIQVSFTPNTNMFIYEINFGYYTTNASDIEFQMGNHKLALEISTNASDFSGANLLLQDVQVGDMLVPNGYAFISNSIANYVLSANTTYYVRVYFYDEQNADSQNRVRFDDFYFNMSEECDTDNDGLINSLDNDSDADGCFDAIEGDGSFTITDVDADGRLTGGVEANGVPSVANSGTGQANTPAVTDDSNFTACASDTAPIVTILEDINNDGFINNTELSGTIEVRVELPTAAVAGNTVTVVDGNGNTITVTLSPLDISNANIEVSFPAPAEGGSINTSATITYGPGIISNPGTDSAKVDTIAPSAPTIIISEDINNDGVIDSSELVGTIEVTITLPADAVENDVLVVVDGNGNTQTIILSADNITATTVTVSFPAPANGGVVNASGTITDQAENTSLAGTDNATININTTPTATSDSLTVEEDSTAGIANQIDVTTNDTIGGDGGDGDDFSIATAPTNGTVTEITDGIFEYIPNTDFNGLDSFTYTITDVDGDSATATVNVTINDVNDAPVANTDTATTEEDTAVAINVIG
ncbi:hypothetical protein C7447_1061, partial [Tenacibaculum adriaticum]